MASAEVPKQEFSGVHAKETGRRPEWLEQSEQGKWRDEFTGEGSDYVEDLEFTGRDIEDFVQRKTMVDLRF